MNKWYPAIEKEINQNKLLCASTYLHEKKCALNLCLNKPIMNRIDRLFKEKHHRVLNVYCTAGYPGLNSTKDVLASLQEHGADIVEIGMPYSDPLADGPVIQHSNMIALENGMSIPVLFEQLKNIRDSIQLPIILMGYMNPILQFGLEKFCKAAEFVGIDGIILPDLPMYEFKTEYQQIFEKFSRPKDAKW